MAPLKGASSEGIDENSRYIYISDTIYIGGKSDEIKITEKEGLLGSIVDVILKDKGGNVWFASGFHLRSV